MLPVLTESLSDKQNAIFRICETFYAGARWWDRGHLDQIRDHMRMIIEGEQTQALSPILLPAAYLHDVGWFFINESTKHTSWLNDDPRRAHMDLGRVLAEEILLDVDYPEELRTEIQEIVGTHDDHYINPGILPTTYNKALVVAADYCFVSTYLSFWKDAVIVGERLQIGPEEFLRRQLARPRQSTISTAERIMMAELANRNTEIVKGDKTPRERYQELKTLADRRIEPILQGGIMMAIQYGERIHRKHPEIIAKYAKMIDFNRISRKIQPEVAQQNKADSLSQASIRD